ncbi:hypothetical protein HY772_08940, partial [Candidatus Woesearchaeota archaeon]|nr:hypothetical protein [Candidatus Woesearchaeota archaeon]
GNLGQIIVQKGQNVQLGDILGISQAQQTPYIIINRIPASAETQLNQAVQNSNANPSSSNVSSFLNQTINIPIVIVPANGQAFTTSFNRHRDASFDIADLRNDVTAPAQEEQRQEEAELLAELERIKEKAKQKVRENDERKTQEDVITVYRVYGVAGPRGPRRGPDGHDYLYGESWTNLDPLVGLMPIPTNPYVGLKTIYRILAGLPNANTGKCLAEGKINRKYTTPTAAKRADPSQSPDPQNYLWQPQPPQPTWPELLIEDAKQKADTGIFTVEQICIPVSF